MANDASRSGTRYDNPESIEFLERTHVNPNEHFQRAFQTPKENDVPAIMVGHSEGKLLAVLMEMIGASKVVEIGTLVGYSGLHLLEGTKPDGHLWTFEFNAAHATLARQNFQAAGMQERVTLVEGSAHEKLHEIEAEGPFDAVFLDADKAGYLAYGKWALKNLRPGGLLIADNVYLFGELMENTERAQKMRDFHELMAAHFDSVCIPTPDGLAVGILRG